ncbi:hypothetical protein [Rhizobium sp. 'Codium 1']|uniref:hypothetical protein n=1 Tax=Rhizobium sp. 'Codium 1' TaxID=2940484 RepID=UPI001E302A3B|nr:hypothetical protein [Rhizobium sp. 'Codium 1']MCC8932029.1 hypothetical protein [Rhizobium sp. 'Codium 1']
MIAEFIASLFALFVVDPVQAEIEGRLAAVQAPIEIVSQARACLGTTGPILIERATGDVWWAGATMVKIATGLTGSVEFLDAGNPACAPVATYLTAAEAEA